MDSSSSIPNRHQNPYRSFSGVVKTTPKQQRSAQMRVSTAAKKLFTPDNPIPHRPDARILRPSKRRFRSVFPPKIPKQPLTSSSLSQPKQEQHDQASNQVIAKLFSQHIGGSDEKGERLFADLVGLLPTIQQNSVKVIPAGEANPDIFLCSLGIVALGKLLGKGTFSKVYKATVFQPGSDMPLEGAVKKSHRQMSINQLEKESRIIATGLSPAKKSGADAPHFIGTDEKGIAYSIHELFEKDFQQIKYSQIENPVLFLVDSFAQLSLTLESFHRNGTVLGDIKPQNMLMHRGTGKAVFSDFGSIHRASRSLPSKVYTSSFADPAFFCKSKDEKPSLAAQVKKSFYSSKESDLYAFGISVERIIYNLLIQKGPHLNIEQSDLLYEARHEHTNLSEDECADYDSRYPGRCIVHFPYMPGGRATVSIKKELSTRYDTAIEKFDRLEAEHVFTGKEVRVLKNILYHAIFSLQDPVPDNRELNIEFFHELKAAFIDPEQLAS